MPAEKATARVRSATTLPQATGHASSGLSCGGARWRLFAMIVSSRVPARSTGVSPKSGKSEEQIVAPDNLRNYATGLRSRDALGPIAAFARFLASLRRCAAEYILPRQRGERHRQGASSSPSKRL